MREQTVVKRRKAGHFQAACVTRSDFLVSNRISSSAARPKAGLCLSWVRMASVCAIDRPAQLQCTLPNRDQQEEQQAKGVDLSLHRSSPDVSVSLLSLPAPSYLGVHSVARL